MMKRFSPPHHHHNHLAAAAAEGASHTFTQAAVNQTFSESVATYNAAGDARRFTKFEVDV